MAVGIGRLDSSASSILEQAVECFAGILGAGRASSGRGLLFNPHADGVELAFVAGIFLGDSFRNRLQALEPLRWIEIGALLARMQFEAALRALT